MKVNRREAIAIGAAGMGLAGTTGGAWAASAGGGVPAAVAPRVCGLVDPLSLGDLTPRFSWRVEGAAQTAYRLTVARDAAALARGDLLWDSGRIASAHSLDIPYNGPALGKRQRAAWQAQVWTGAGAPLRTPVATFETGLFAQADWQAQWLASETATARADRLAGLHWIGGDDRLKVDAVRGYRWTFDSKQGGPAELCISAHEAEGVWVNGERIAARQDGPVHWTQMAVYPVTLKPGRNVVAVPVRRRTGLGTPNAFLAALLREGRDLAQRRTSADAGWKTSIVLPQGWQSPAFDDAGWSAAVAGSGGLLPRGEPWPTYPASRLRRGFTVSRPLRAARLYATALGYYDAHLNGGPVDDRRFAPEFTDPSKRIMYQAYDVTDRVRPGDNVLGFEVADGWYGGKYSSGSRFSFGSAPCRIIAQLELEYADGTREMIATGPGWEIGESPVREAGIYDGEVFDARLDAAGWTVPGGQRAGWRPADVIDAPAALPIDPQRCPPMRVTQQLAPKAVRKLASGRYVVDFGQNFAGWVRLSLSAPAGTRVTMRFAELINADGSVDQSNLRTAWARDVYIAAGGARETWEPRFTYHGFRYVEIAGVPDDAAAWSVEGRVCHQDLPLTADLRVGDPVVQKFWENSVWSQKSNFYGLPTDCPQRDERLGWMGDAEVFWPAASFNMDTQAYTARVMDDVRAGQGAAGGFPDCIPPFLAGMNMSSPGWADAGIILPYTAWQQFGDGGVIDANWPAMERYMAWIAKNNPDHLWTKSRGADYGDWLAVDAPTSNAGYATTPKDLIGTAFWAENARMMAQMAAATGRTEAATRYRALFDTIRAAFNAAYVKPDGSVGNNSQTSFVLAIRFGLLSPAATAEAGRRLAADIARRGNHLSTGFLGTPHILDALALAGQEATAITLLTQRTFPSWGYMVEKGATSMWERWNSDQGDTGMNSRNHYAFGAIGAFLFRRVAGIDPVEPGFARIRVAPIMDPRLGTGGATYRSNSGTIRTDWTVQDGRYRLDVEVPAGVMADVHLPSGNGRARVVRARTGPNRYSGAMPAARVGA